MLIIYHHLDRSDMRRERCCDDERELLLAAELALGDERATRDRNRMRAARRLLGRRIGFPYPGRARRAARVLAAAAVRQRVGVL